MSRPGITYDDVANAALQLTAQGKYPTIEAIRLLIGTGSNTTIAQRLKEWKHKQTQAKSLGDDVPEEIAITVKGLWEQLVTEANEKVAEIKQEFEQKLTEFKEKNENLKEDNSRWQKQYQQLEEEKGGLACDKIALEEILEHLKRKRSP